MSQTTNTGRPAISQEEEIDLREQVTLYLRHWPWFILGVLLCLMLAFLYLRYTTPVYNTVATIIIKDEEQKGGAADLSAFAGMGMLTGIGTNSIENEIGILKSKRLITSVAQNLNLNLRYFEEGTVRTTELYNQKPFNIQVLSLDEEKLKDLGPFHIELLNEEFFEIQNEELGINKKVAFGAPLKLPFGEIVVTPNILKSEDATENSLLVLFNTVDGAAENYRNKIAVNLTDKNSTLIELSLQDPVKEKAQDILNRLIFQYNNEAKKDKREISENTAEFIKVRLDIISEELDSVERNKVQFKTENRLTDIQAESQLFIENASDFRKEQLEVETQLELANSMIEYLRKNENNGLLPANLGFTEASLVSAIENYNQIVLERNRILSGGSTQLNPVIVNLNNQIQQMDANIMQSLMNLRSSLLISQREFEEREAEINAQIANVPSKEKEFRGIERQQNIKEALYLFLLQKREETSLALAATASKAKIVDSAYSSKEPVSPKPKIIMLAAFILGLLIPFLIIYIKNLLNNKIRSRADIEKQAGEIPIVGEIPQISKNEKELVEVNDRSVLAESFRILHTNMQYLLLNAGKKPGGNTIFITSTVKGEGKTFVAFNLALTLANTGKKVLIVGADLRNPQLQRYETDIHRNKGVSDYLVGDQWQLKDLIKQSSFHSNLDILVSGTIPPNPSELWRQEKAATFFEEIKHMYDYLIIDTAPAMLVTDTFLINQYADTTLYVARAGYTEKKIFDFAIDSKNQGKLHHVGFVLNDVAGNNFGYGNKYGYAYGEEEKTFLQKIGLKK